MPRRNMTAAVKTWGTALAYLAVLSLSFHYKEPILHWLQTGEMDDIPLMVLVTAFLGMVPIIPFGVAAGAMGAKFGLFWGSVISVIGSVLAAVLMFGLVRYLFAEQGRAYLSRFQQMDRFTRMVEDNAFAAVFTARLIPIVPALAVNVYAALSRMALLPYVLATLLGKVPTMLMFAFVGDRLFTNWLHSLAAVLIYAGVIAAVLALLRKRRRPGIDQ
jgi:uncharacterized membrane protein YdjX (TVP38/TMEM64 family)